MDNIITTFMLCLCARYGSKHYTYIFTELIILSITLLRWVLVLSHFVGEETKNDIVPSHKDGVAVTTETSSTICALKYTNYRIVGKSKGQRRK